MARFASAVLLVLLNEKADDLKRLLAKQLCRTVLRTVQHGSN